MIVVVMGVAGSGKTTVGMLLASELGWPFYDADDFHPATNVERMRRGIPLTDADRAPWLESLHRLMADLASAGKSAVLACSALKQRYRDALLGPDEPTRSALAPHVRFVYLKIDPSLARERLAERKGHYMPASLADSQFAALEEPNPTDALTVDAADPPATITARIRAGLGSRTEV